MRLWLREDNVEEQKGKANSHRVSFGTEFVVQPASSRHHSHAVSVYREHSVHQNSPLCLGDIICAPKTQYAKCLEMRYDVSEHQIKSRPLKSCPEDYRQIYRDPTVRDFLFCIFSIGGPSESKTPLSQLDYGYITFGTGFLTPLL